MRINISTPYTISILAFFGGLLLSHGCKKAPSEPANLPPQIQLTTLDGSYTSVSPADTLYLVAAVEDEEPVDSLNIQWSATGGELMLKSRTRADWLAPKTPGLYWIRVWAADPDGAAASDSLVASVGNRPPVIYGIAPDSAVVVIGNPLIFICQAADSDGHDFTIDWEVSGGTILDARGDSLRWQAPTEPGVVSIRARATDIFQAADSASTSVLVYREAGTVWVVDTGNQQVVKLASNGRVLRRVEGFHTPAAVDLDPVRRVVWVADPAPGTVTLLDFDGRRIAQVSSLGAPFDLDVFQTNGRCWVAETDSNRISEIARDGSTVLRTIYGFLHPRSLCIDEKNGDIYVADTGNHRVVQLQAAVPDSYSVAADSGFHRIYTGFLTPLRVKSHLLEESVWIVDRLLEKAFHISRDDSVRIAVSGLRLPEDLAIDSHRGIVWIADTGNGRVLKVENLSVTAVLNGMLLPQSLSVDPNDGSLWIADTENDRILHYDVQGNLLLAVYGFSSPRGICVNPGQ